MQTFACVNARYLENLPSRSIAARTHFIVKNVSVQLYIWFDKRLGKAFAAELAPPP
jgi:hypothetical protein